MSSTSPRRAGALTTPRRPSRSATRPKPSERRLDPGETLTTQGSASPRAGLPSLKELRSETEILNEPIHQDARARIADHIRRLRAARTLADLFEMQRQLLIEFWAWQRSQQDLRADIADMKAAVKTLAPAGVSEDLLAAQRRFKIARRQDRAISAIMHALRSVADGLAWKALLYDRLAIATFGRGRRVGRLADGPGLDSELDRLAAYWSHGVLALLNDLTNVLRHGDLTPLRWTVDRGETSLEADVEEVKTGRHNPNSAQFRRIADAIEFLQKGEHPTLADGAPLAALRVPHRYRTFQADLRAVLAKARAKGCAAVISSPCQAVMAVDMTIAGGRMPELVMPVLGKLQRQLRWWEPGRPEPFVFTASFRRMRDRRDAVVTTAPFAIFPLPPEDAADLILGYLDFVSYLNADVLQAIFRAKGFHAQVARPPESQQRFLVARGVGYGYDVRVPAGIREQMMLELMTPASLVASTKAALGDAKRREGKSELVVVFDDESSVWGR